MLLCCVLLPPCPAYLNRLLVPRPLPAPLNPPTPAAARHRGSKSDEGLKKAASSATGGRLVDEASGEINTGRLETATNPLFLSQGGEGAKITVGGGNLSVDMVMAQRSPPPPETWALFQHEFAQLAAQVEQAKQQALDAKKAVATGAGAADDEDGGRPSARKAKAEFAPRGAAEPSSAAKLMLSKKSSKKAAAF